MPPEISIAFSDEAVGETFKSFASEGVEISISAPTPNVLAGEQIQYTLAVENYSRRDQNVALEYEFPRKGLYVSSNPELPFLPSQRRMTSFEERKLAWKINVPAGERKQWEVTVFAMKDEDSLGNLMSFTLTAAAGVSPIIYVHLTTELSPASGPVKNPEKWRQEKYLIAFAVFAFVGGGYGLLCFLGMAFPNSKGVAAAKLAYLAVLGTVWFGAWSSVPISDIRQYSDYQKTSCTVLDSSTHIGGSDTCDYRLGLEYDVLGKKMVSSGYGAASRGNTSGRCDPSPDFIIARKYPCWYDPKDPTAVVVKRGIDVITYILLLISAALWGGCVWATLGELKKKELESETSPDTEKKE